MDVSLQKELRVRRRIESVYNKAREAFASKEEYDDYLEEREEIIFNVLEGIDVEATEARIAAYQKENREQILASHASQAGAAMLSNAEPRTEVTVRNDGNPLQEAPQQMAYSAPAAAMMALPVPISTQVQPLPEKAQATPSKAEGNDVLRMGLASGWTPELPKQRDLEEAFSTIFVC